LTLNLVFILNLVLQIYLTYS